MPKFLNWSNRYKIGQPLIDLQHKELFRIINTLYESGENLLIQKNCFFDLQAYAAKHFTTEEEIMRLHGYPEDRLIEHRKEHHLFSHRVESFLKSSIKGEKILEIAVVYLKTWIVHHVLEVDRDMIDYLKVPLRV